MRESPQINVEIKGTGSPFTYYQLENKKKK